MAITKVSPGLLDLDSGITISVADNSDNLTLTSTDADANSGPNLRMYRNSSSPADNDYIGEIQFEGRNDNSQDVVYAGLQGRVLDASDGTEDGRFELYTIRNGAQTSMMMTSASEIIINNDGIDLDFRIESDGNPNMFTVDAGNNDVLIGNTVAGVASSFDNQAGFSYQSEGIVQIANTNDATTLVLGKNQGTDGNWIDFRKQSTSIGQIGMTGTNDIMMFSNAANHTGLRLGEGYYIPTNNVGASNDNGVDLGLPSVRYKDIYLGGGAFIGGTGSANKLDDYEEGNYTPTFVASGGTAPGGQSGTGKYVKVGSVVHVHGQITWTSAGSGGSNIHVVLPFNVLSNARAGGAVGLQAGIVHTAGHYMTLVPEINDNKMYLLETQPDSAGHDHLNYGNVTADGSKIFSFSATYTVS